MVSDLADLPLSRLAHPDRSEPHCHDPHDILFFFAGTGAVWVDDFYFSTTTKLTVYTPKGVMHHFKMYSNDENKAVVTRIESQNQPVHILLEHDGLLA